MEVIDMQEKYREKYRLLGLRIAMYRKLRGYTQETFADAIDKSWSFVSQFEANNGKEIKGMSLDTLFTISEVLDVPLNKLFDEM